MNLFNPPKLVTGIHIRFGENPIALLSLFSLHASKQNWDQQEILNVMDRAQTGDYLNLIKTLRAHIQC